ncbi:MAG: serine hydrolase domain-containing protein [Tepidisphaeraceae bacterium]
MIFLSLLLLVSTLTTVGPRDCSAELADIVEKYNVPGIVAVATRHDQIVIKGAAGVRKVGADACVTLDDQFHIGSCTKAMTATLCALLVEEGKLKWTDTIPDVFPELADSIDPEWREVTLERLLSHRGGVPPNIDAPGVRGKVKLTGPIVEQRQILLEAVVASPPLSKPGSQFLYSNLGYTIAGHMAEKVTGKSWEELMGERIFAPLKMSSAGFGAPGETETLDQPRGHSAAGAPIEPGPAADNPPLIGPAGTVHCTIGDWSKFVALHLLGDEGDATLLKSETFRKLHIPPPDKTMYAMGWGVAERPWGGGDILTHAGSNTLWHAVVFVAPKRDFAILVCCNAGGDVAAKACDDAASMLVNAMTR